MVDKSLKFKGLPIKVSVQFCILMCLFSTFHHLTRFCNIKYIKHDAYFYFDYLTILNILIPLGFKVEILYQMFRLTCTKLYLYIYSLTCTQLYIFNLILAQIKSVITTNTSPLENNCHIHYIFKKIVSNELILNCD